MQIAQYADRKPDKLSGGQQQRVTLACALAVNLSVLLMDEPLSNLEAKLRLDMRQAIREIQHEVGITTVYVTHDQEEAMAISDQIAVMKDGVIQQISRPKNSIINQLMSLWQPLSDAQILSLPILKNGATALISSFQMAMPFECQLLIRLRSKLFM